MFTYLFNIENIYIYIYNVRFTWCSYVNSIFLFLISSVARASTHFKETWSNKTEIVFN